MVFDEFDYLPVIGGSVYINGMMRAQAGTGGKALPPHLPIGGPAYGPPPPTNEAEVFMGSQTVAVDGDAQSYQGLPVLTCQAIGAPAPTRPKGQPPKSLVLPSGVLLAIPAGPLVSVGGPPTVSLAALGARAAPSMFGKLGGMLRKAQRGGNRFGQAMRRVTDWASERAARTSKRLGLGPAAQRRIKNAVCTVTGHPVDVASGRVFTEHSDFASIVSWNQSFRFLSGDHEERFVRRRWQEHWCEYDPLGVPHSISLGAAGNRERSISHVQDWPCECSAPPSVHSRCLLQRSSSPDFIH